MVLQHVTCMHRCTCIQHLRYSTRQGVSFQGLPAPVGCCWALHCSEASCSPTGTHLPLLCDVNQPLVCQLPSCLPGGLHECPPVTLGAQLHTAVTAFTTSFSTVPSSAWRYQSGLCREEECVSHIIKGHVGCLAHFSPGVAPRWVSM